MPLVRSLATLVAVACLAVQTAMAEEPPLYNVASTTLGATAVGTGSNFNKDWPAINALKPGRRGGTIFSPFEGATIDITLVKPMDLAAIEIVGLDYRGTRLVAAAEIYVDGQKLLDVQLPDEPGQPVRFPLAATGQQIRIHCTASHPRRTKKDGSLGAPWGGFERIRVYSTTDLPALMEPPASYATSRIDAAIAPTIGSVVTGGVQVHGQPRQTEGHPCTIWDQQDIDELKALLKTNAELQRQLAGLKSGADERMTQPVGVPEPVRGEDGNWTHLPTSQVAGIHTKLSLDLVNLATVYVLTDEEKYAEFAKQILLAYAAAFPNYAPGNRPGFTHDSGKLYDQRLGDAIWLMQTARAYDLIYNLPSITETERERIEQDLLHGAATFIAANGSVMRSPTNWSAICTSAVLITGYAIDDEALIQTAMYGIKGTAEKPTGGVVLHFGPKSIDVDGMWGEGAMGYQFMAMQALIADAEILWHHGIDMYRYRDGVLKRLFDSPLEVCYPDLSAPAINDSNNSSIIGRESYLYEFAYRRYGDPRYRLILNQTGRRLGASYQQFTVSTLFDYDVNSESPAVEWQDVNLFGVGYGIQRNTSAVGTNSVLIDYGPNRSHGHPDKLNLDIWALNGRLMPDPGIVWYEQPLYKNWYHTTIAHNTLTVDELEQLPTDGEQLVFGPGDSLDIQRSRAVAAFPGVLMDRAVFVTRDYVADIFGAFTRLPRKMDLAWHVRGEFSADLALEPFAFPEPRQRGYSELTNVTSTETADAWQAAYSFNDMPARLIAAGGTPTQVIVADGILHRETPKTVIQRRVSGSTVYGNVLDISAAAEPVVRGAVLSGGPEAGYSLLTIQTVRGQDLAYTAWSPGSRELDGFSTDAQQAMVTRDGEQITAAYLGGGTRLAVGDVVLSRAEPGLASVERTETGSVLVINASPTPADISLTLAGLPTAAWQVDMQGRRADRIAANAISRQGDTVTLTLPAASRVEFAADGIPSVYDNRQAMLRRQQAERDAAVEADRQAALDRRAARVAASEAAPVSGVILPIQAEAFAAQGEGQTKTANKQAAIGQAILGWDGTGHWIDYSVEAPQAGYYHLAMLYCTELSAPTRELLVNGEPGDSAAPMVFPSTGGWARSSDDWRLFTYTNEAAGAPALIHLKAGPNTLRFINSSGGGVNLDWLVIYSPDQAPSRDDVAARLQAD